MADAGVVDDELHVVELPATRRDPVEIGDVELDRHNAWIGDGRDVARRGVDLRGAALEQRVGERLADPAVCSGD